MRNVGHSCRLRGAAFDSIRCAGGVCLGMAQGVSALGILLLHKGLGVAILMLEVGLNERSIFVAESGDAGLSLGDAKVIDKVERCPREGGRGVVLRQGREARTDVFYLLEIVVVGVQVGKVLSVLVEPKERWRK